jgi:hypothetical protein
MTILTLAQVPFTAITIVSIILATIVGAFLRKRNRDNCLRDFEHNMVTMEEISGKTVWGKLRVENTGLEFVYSDKYQDADGHEETSFILYKYEYPKIQAVIRFHDNLNDKNKMAREKELKRSYHPGTWRRFKRKLLNFFRTIRDSVAEIINVLISQVKKTTPAGRIFSAQDKYVNQMKQELMDSVGTSYEPLLERYIGNRVVLEMIKGDKVLEYSGVLKDYTADFIEIMDTNYSVTETEPARKADIIVPRKLGVVRHLGE